MRCSRLQRLCKRREDLENLLQHLELRFATFLPVHPVALQTLADPQPVLVQTFPDFLGLEVVGGRTVGVVAPIVAGRVPDRKSAINADVKDDAGHRRTTGIGRPAGIAAPELGHDRLGDPALSLDLVLDGGVLPTRRRKCRSVRPGACQGPPGQIQEEALAQAVVAGDHVQAVGEVDPQMRSQSHVLEFKMLQHSSTLRSQRCKAEMAGLGRSLLEEHG